MDVLGTENYEIGHALGVGEVGTSGPADASSPSGPCLPLLQVANLRSQTYSPEHTLRGVVQNSWYYAMELFLQSPVFTLHTHLLGADCLQPLYLGLETKGDHDLVSPVEELPPAAPHPAVRETDM